jgi:hypothetical protein
VDQERNGHGIHLGQAIGPVDYIPDGGKANFALDRNVGQVVFGGVSPQDFGKPFADRPAKIILVKNKITVDDQTQIFDGTHIKFF